jgi:hypothetical protein
MGKFGRVSLGTKIGEWLIAGRIPEMQRRKLASSAVGVVGADTSMASALHHTGRVMRSVDQQNKQQEAKRSAAESKSNVSLANVKFRREVSAAGADKTLSEEDYYARLDELQEKYTGELDEDSRPDFITTSSATLVRAGEDYHKIKETRKMNTIVGNHRAADDEAANEVTEILGSELDPSSKMLAVSRVIQGRQDDYDKHIGDFDPLALDNAKKGSKFFIASSAVRDLIDADPESVDGFIDALQSSGTFTIKEEDAFRKQASDMAASKEKTRKINQTRLQNTTGQNWAQRSAQEDFPTEKEMAIAIQEGSATEADRKSVRDVKASTRKVFIGDNPQAEGELFTQYSAIAADLAEVDDDLEPILMANISSFRQKIMESMEAGTVSAPVGRKWLNRVEPAFQGGIASLVKRITVEEKGMMWGTNFVEMITKPEDVASAKSAFTNELMDRIDIAEEKEKAALKPSDIKVIMDGVTADFVLQTNANAGTFKLGDIVEKGGEKYKVTGKNLAGEPLYDDNLNAPISVVPQATKLRK